MLKVQFPVESTTDLRPPACRAAMTALAREVIAANNSLSRALLRVPRAGLQTRRPWFWQLARWSDMPRPS